MADFRNLNLTFEQKKNIVSSIRMSYVKKEGAKKRKVDTNAGLSVGDMKDMYSLEEDGLEIVEMEESEEEEKEEEVRKMFELVQHHIALICITYVTHSLTHS